MSNQVPQFEKDRGIGEILGGRSQELSEAELIAMASIEADIGPEIDESFARVETEQKNIDSYAAIAERELSGAQNPILSPSANLDVEAVRSEVDHVFTGGAQ